MPDTGYDKDRHASTCLRFKMGLSCSAAEHGDTYVMAEPTVPLDAATQIDPAAIMAEHHPNAWVNSLGTSGWYCEKCEAAVPEEGCLSYRLAAENAALREQLDETAEQRDEQTALADRYWQETDEALRARNAMREQAQRVLGQHPHSDACGSSLNPYCVCWHADLEAALDGDQPTGEAEAGR